MVDSPNETTMTDGSNNLPERLEVVEHKLDGLIQSVDVRFDEVAAAIAEQRAYTEFAIERLDSKMDAGFARLDQKIDDGSRRVDGRFDQLERKMDQINDRLERKIDQINDGLERKIDQINDRLERKIDQIIDLHVPKTPPDASNLE